MASLRPHSLYDLASFARASAANYRDSTGAVVSAAADEARIDRDPLSLAVRGLLIEEARTNLLLNSAALSTQSVSVTAQAYTLSFYGTGTVTLSGASTAGPLTGTATGTRVSLTFTPSAGSLTLTVSGSVLYAQLEAGQCPTTWITTTGTSASRARETCAISGFGPLHSTAGTLYAEVLMPFTPPSDGVLRRIVQLDAGSEADRISLHLSGASVYMDMQTASAAQVSASLGSLTANVAKKVAYAWSTNDCAGVIGGGNIVTDTSATVPTGLTTARLGNASASGSDLSGYIRAVRYYPRRLTNNELTALVA